MKRLLLLLALALLAAACASGTSDTTTTVAAIPSGVTELTSPATVPSTPPSTSAEAPTDGPPGTEGEPEKPLPEGPVAPDFTTVLASGESFTLSEATKPVYMVFWAEW